MNGRHLCSCRSCSARRETAPTLQVSSEEFADYIADFIRENPVVTTDDVLDAVAALRSLTATGWPRLEQWPATRRVVERQYRDTIRDRIHKYLGG